MEESGLVRCDSLDTASLGDRDMVDHMIFSSDQDSGAGPEPTPAELAQCEAEVGTLLSIIAELNKKMGSLKAPSEPGDMRPSAASRPLVPDLLSHRLKNTERKAMESRDQCKPPLMDRVCPPGGSGVVWTRLQDVLSSVEDSISFRRSWAAPITAVDVNKHKEHIRAAQESSVKASQILEEMEREFGISCTNVQSKDHFQEEIPDPSLSSLQNQQHELERAHSIGLMEEEKDKLVSLQKAWRSGRRSPSYRPSGMSCAGSVSPDWASPPYPGSPLVHRRTSRGIPPLSAAGDMSPLGTGNSNSPCTSPIGPEGETERLNRCVERLKARNERLSVALERKKSESEHMSLTLNKLESDCSALHTALKYSEECEEAYTELLSLYEAKTHQSIRRSIPGTTGAAGGGMPCFNTGHPRICTGGMPITDTNVYPDFSGTSEEAGVRSNSPISNMDTEELSTSFSTAAGTEEIEVQRPPDPDREVILRQQIERLQKERSSLGLSKPGLVECKPIPDTTLGSRAGHRPDTKKEKASLFYELISVREEMSDLRALIRLKEKELRCIEWSLMAQKTQDAAGAFIPEREELEERKTEQQRLCEMAAKLGTEGDLSRPILKELQAVLQREQALRKRLALVQDSMNTALSDNVPQRRDSGGEMARLTQAHSKALSSYRQIRRKYREQVWRLEQKVAAVRDSQQSQGQGGTGAVKSTGGDHVGDWRREETVL